MLQDLLRRRVVLFRKLAGMGMCLLLLAACSSPSVAPEELRPAPPTVPASGLTGQQADGDLDALMAIAGRDGVVRVLVELQVPSVPEHRLAPGAVGTQRDSISAAQDSLMGRLQSSDAQVLRRFRTLPVLAMTVDARALQQLLADPAVQSVTADVVDDAFLAESTTVIGADMVWNGVPHEAGQGWAVAILDTGVDLDHEVFAGRIVAEACFSSTVPGQSESLCPEGGNVEVGTGTGDACASDCSHGTHVAAIAAGLAPESPPQSVDHGVAPGADIIAVQVFSDFSEGCGSSPCIRTWRSDYMAALEFILELQLGNVPEYAGLEPDIASVNMSLGGGRHFEPCDAHPIRQLIEDLRAEGIATVVASGNNGYVDSISFPACVSTAISVGSTGDGSWPSADLDVVSGFSNRSDQLRLLAPGDLITAAVPGSYASHNGTSMAAPHVAGAWALMKKANPDLTVGQVLAALTQSGVMVTDFPGRQLPRIQVDEAILLPAAEPTLDPSLQYSQLMLSKTRVSPDGSDYADITVELRDVYGDRMPVSDVTVTLQSSQGLIDSVVSNGDGIYSARIYGAAPGPALIQAYFDGTVIDRTAALHFVPPPGPGPLLWDQPVDIGEWIVSSYSTNLSASLHAADDFRITHETTIEYIEVYGFDSNDLLEESPEIRWFVYPDDDGKPAGLPGTVTAQPVWSFSGKAWDPGVATTVEDGIILDLQLAGAPELTLEPGSYWLSIAPGFEGDLLGADSPSWSWEVTGQVTEANGMVFAPAFSVPVWTDLAEVFGSPRDLTFQLYGSYDVDFSASTLTALPASLPADGTSTAELTLQLRTLDGTEFPHSAGPVTMQANQGLFGPVADNGDGSYTAVYTSGTTPGGVSITAHLAGVALGAGTTVTLEALPDPTASLSFTGSAGAGGAVTPGATRIPLLSATATVPADSEPVSISGFTLTVSGTSMAGNIDASGIAALEVLQGDALLGSTSTLAGNGNATITLAEPVLVVAGAEAEFTVTLSVTATAVDVLAEFVLAGLFGMPLALLLSRGGRRRIRILALGVAITLLMVACGGAGGGGGGGGTKQYSYTVDLTGVTASSGALEVQTSGLPIEGAEVTFALPAD